MAAVLEYPWYTAAVVSDNVGHSRYQVSQYTRARDSLSPPSRRQSAPSRSSSVTSSASVLKRQEAAAWAMQSPLLRMLAPVAEREPP